MLPPTLKHHDLDRARRLVRRPLPLYESVCESHAVVVEVDRHAFVGEADLLVGAVPAASGFSEEHVKIVVDVVRVVMEQHHRVDVGLVANPMTCSMHE